MRTDRELLELAAKAAGREVGREDQGDPIDRKYSEGLGLWCIGPWAGWFNPLTDDGDALRLAVKLGEKFPCFMLGIFSRAEFPHVGASITHREGSETYAEQECGDDINAATRRAIVRAAAEIGAALNQEGGSNE